MTEVIIRYGCDGGCGRYFTNKDDLIQVDVQQIRGLNNGKTVYMTDRYELWCFDCKGKHDAPKRREWAGPSKTTPGFKING